MNVQNRCARRATAGKLPLVGHVLDPPGVLKAKFESLVAPLWARIHENSAKAQTLAEIRDTLLPRLISGKLRLPDAERQVAENLA